MQTDMFEVTAVENLTLIFSFYAYDISKIFRKNKLNI